MITSVVACLTEKANLNLEHNLWYDIFDHNDPNKTGENSSLIPKDQYEEPWFPSGPCTPAIALTEANSVHRTDDQAPGQVTLHSDQMA